MGPAYVQNIVKAMFYYLNFYFQLKFVSKTVWSLLSKALSSSHVETIVKVTLYYQNYIL